MPKKRLSRLILIFVFLFSLPVTVFAVNGEPTTVRVGWYYSDMFQLGMTESSIKSGYSYDYLQSIADYSNWNYEYVYGEWSELIHKMETGEIDILAGISKSPEREKSMYFPDYSMGSNHYYLFKRADDNSIKEDDYSTIKGKKIGCIVNNRNTDFTKKWIADNQLDVDFVYYKSFTDLAQAFENKEVDLLTQSLNNVHSISNIVVFTRVGEEPYYLAVSKKAPELLPVLNSSITTMISISPFLLQNLQFKHFGSILSSKSFTDKEEEWIQNHNAIVVGYLDDFLPFSDTTKDGKPTGLMTDVLSEIFEELGIANKIYINYRPYDNYDKLITDLKNSKINIAFPVYGDFWMLDQDGIDASSPVVTCREIFFYKGTYDKDKITKVAVNENNRIHLEYSKKVFPEVEFCSYPSIYACLKAVQNGDVDGTVLNTLRSQLVTGNSKYSNLNFVQLDQEDSKCFGLNDSETELLLLLNRGLKVIGESFGIDNSYKYIAEFYNYTTMDFIRHNILWIGLIFVTMAFIICFVLLFNLQRKEKNVRAMDVLNTQMERSKRMADKANRAKTNFLFNMSHDIRTPMNAIIGFANLMEKEINNPEKLKEYIDKMKISGDYLLTLINNVLEVARIDSGKESVDETFTDLMDRDCSVIPVLENEIAAKKINFDQHMNITHRYVWADMAKIREVTMNIMSNAIKYTPEGGTISLQFDEVPATRPGYARYINTISDTGIGMSEEFLEHIFDSFSRERNTTESKIGGTGLGMSIVKKLVDILGGTIEVKSELGKGSTFIVTMEHKIIDEPENYIEAQRRIATRQLTDLKGKCFLLVEDNELNAEIGTAILEDLGAKVEHAFDGVECIDMLMKHPSFHYDYVLMDIQMPNMNGYEATKRIRSFADKEKSLIPIIAMTANAFDEDRQNALAAGMNAHLPKPVEVTKLLETLSSL